MDPIGVWGDPWNFGNELEYSRSSPLTFGDPMGLQGQPASGLGTGAAVALGTGLAVTAGSGFVSGPAASGSATALASAATSSTGASAGGAAGIGSVAGPLALFAAPILLAKLHSDGVRKRMEDQLHRERMRLQVTAFHAEDPVAAEKMAAPGDCHEARAEYLQARVDHFCKSQGYSCRDGYKAPCIDGKEYCKDYWDRAQRARACRDARKQVNRECFRGGNQTHRDEVDKAEAAYKKCMERWHLCIGGSPGGGG